MGTFRKLIVFAILLVCITCKVSARDFVHPGTIFNQSDLDRMKAMVAAKKEPFYSEYQRMKGDAYTSRGARDMLTQIKESQFNGTVGTDGRAALQQALVWKIEGIKSYADRAVAILNAYRNLKNCSSRGTGPLDNGKVFALIDAAELMRDYEGWSQEDQQAFKDMLVYPGYSNTENYYEKYASGDDSKNGITFYWNIFNGDSGRHGNQGICAMRGLLSMAIFLDNETMYERAIRKLKSMPHPEGDLPFPSGPRTSTSSGKVSSNGNYIEWQPSELTSGGVEDYGFDDEIKYYIYENGQNQEQCRDQGHVMAGLMMLSVITRVAWNQGEDLFHLDFGLGVENRFLKGMEYESRYNMSYLNKQKNYAYWSSDSKQAEVFEPTPVEDTGYNTITDQNKFIQRRMRCGRWLGLRSSTDGRGAYIGQGINDIYNMFKVQLGIPEDEMLWTSRMRQVNFADNGGYEAQYASGHHYENLGWGGLTGERTPWMAGDGGQWVDGKFVPGLPQLPGTIIASDYDHYVGAPLEGQKDGANGHTYFNDGTTSWKNYTVAVKSGGGYRISLYVKASKGGAKVTVQTDDANGKVSLSIPATDGYEKLSLGQLTMTNGAKVLRVTIEGDIDDVDIKSIAVEKTKFRVLTMKVEEGAKYSTFVAPFDVKMPAGVTAYKVNCDGQTLTLTPEAKENETLKADHPVLIYSEKAFSKSLSGTGSDSNDDVFFGSLVGKYQDQKDVLDDLIYVFSEDSTTPAGFYKSNKDLVTMYHAYLKLPATSSADKFLINDPTGINDLNQDFLSSPLGGNEGSLEGVSPTGIKVGKGYKGIVINRGKKYIAR